MDDLLLHPSTKKAVLNLIQKQPHGILLLAPAGAGKESLARALSAALLSIPASKILETPALLSVKAEKSSITIEQIRKLQTFLKLRVPGSAQIRRAVIITDAHLMTTEAQNALLKALEEPPEDTILILTATPDGALLPTIYSRIQSLRLIAPSLDDAKAYFKTKGREEQDINRAYQIADGQIGLLNAILNEEAGHPLLQGIATAKTIITSSAYDRLRMVESLLKDFELSQLLFALKRVYSSVLMSAGTRNSQPDIERAAQALQAIEYAQAAHAAHATPKLILTDLFIHL